MNKIQKIAGVLSSQEILELINKNVITSENGIEKGLIQPASIDLRLGIKRGEYQPPFFQVREIKYLID